MSIHQKPHLTQSLLVILMTWTIISPIQIQSEFICPEPEELEPCTCNEGQDSLACTGPEITQEAIDNLFNTVRSLNNITDFDWLEVRNFKLSSTNLTVLDLTPYAKTFFSGSFEVSTNFLLTQIQPGVNSSEEVDIEPYRFNINQVWLTNAGLWDSDLNEFFKFIDPENVTSISLTANNLEGSNGQFFPSSFDYSQLHWLSLVGNQIQKVEGGQFEFNNQLTYLGLNGNQISQLGRDAFKFQEPDEDWVDKLIRIRLDDNQLTDERVNLDHGLTSIGRPTELILNSNYFEFISKEKFESFLLANDRNYLELDDCQFICDERMQWLRDQREDFQHRVIGVTCQNDPGKTIFTTDLLP